MNSTNVATVVTRISCCGVALSWCRILLAIWLSVPGTLPAQEINPRVLFGGHSKVVSRIAISADGKWLATASYDRTTKIWNLADGREVSVGPGHGDVSFSPDGSLLAVGGHESPVKICNLPLRSDVAKITLDYNLLRLDFTPNGKSLITAGEGPIKLFDPRDGSEQKVLNLIMEKNNANLVLDLAVAPDGKTLCTGHANGKIMLWDLASRTNREFPSGSERPLHREVASTAFSSDGKTVACGFGDGTIKAWDVVTAKEYFSRKAHSVRVWSVAFSPDNSLLASAGWDGKVKLWDVADGEARAIFEAHVDRVYAVAFTPDGKSLVSGGGIQFERGEAKLWLLQDVLKATAAK